MADGHVLQGPSPATMRKQLNWSELAESVSTIVQGQGMNSSLFHEFAFKITNERGGFSSSL